MARITSTSSLTDAETKSLAPAHAKVAQSLAGRVLYLAELVQGQIPVTLGRQATLPNPQGLIGIDHSGPPWGSAFLHPLLTMGGCLADASGDCVGQRVVGRFSSTDALTIPMRLYIRPFANYAGAPYSRAYMTARVARVSGAGAVAFTITMRKPGGGGAPMVDTDSVSTTTPEAITPDAYFSCVPGHNDIELEFSSASATQLVVEQFQLFVGTKRKYP